MKQETRLGTYKVTCVCYFWAKKFGDNNTRVLQRIKPSLKASVFGYFTGGQVAENPEEEMSLPFPPLAIAMVNFVNQLFERPVRVDHK